MGRNPEERLRFIGEIDGTHLDILSIGNAEVRKAVELYRVSRVDSSMQALDSVSLESIWAAISPDCAALVFWVDDGKTVGRTFPLDMAMPLSAPGGGRPGAAEDVHLHYWDGNALAVSRRVAESLVLADMNLRDDSLLTFVSDMVDRRLRLGDPKLRVMLSSLERFAAIEAPPVGLAS